MRGGRYHGPADDDNGQYRDYISDVQFRRHDGKDRRPVGSDKEREAEGFSLTAARYASGGARGVKGYHKSILRRVFGIDKYQRIFENSKKVVSVLKDRKKENEYRISGLQEKINEVNEKKEKIGELKSIIGDLGERLREITSKIDGAKKQIELVEAEKLKRDNLQKELELSDNNLTNFMDRRIDNNKKIEELRSDINSFETQLKERGIGDVLVLQKKILDKEQDLRRQEVELKEVLKKLHEADMRITESSKNIEGILSLEFCPYCRQKVCEEHKNNISKLEEIKIKENRELLDNSKLLEKETEKIISKLKEELEELRKQKSEVELFKFKKESLAEKTKQLDKLLAEQKGLKLKIGEMNVKKKDISLELEKIPDVQEMYGLAKEKVDELLREERKLVAEKAGASNEFNIFAEIISKLNKEILDGEKIKEEVFKQSKLISWFELDFVNLVQRVEKQIMMKVHSDFDSLFKEWFSILIGESDLKVKLDYEFTPLIEQNGYDNDYLHLSGGEKTAMALAYRLALNQVINTVMSEINTKDLLILDEPTDGFSSEQVDKIRLILEELGVRQTIIVSHDPKIESFVDSVIRFEKNDGVSGVIS